MEKLNLLVLFGGKSSEYEVSLVSASSIIKNADKEKYNLITVGIIEDIRLSFAIENIVKG